MYDPIVGRWRQEDPIRWQARDVNLSRYVRNVPTNDVDPSGLCWKPDPDISFMTLVDDWSVEDGLTRWVDQSGHYHEYLLGPEQYTARLSLSDQVDDGNEASPLSSLDKLKVPEAGGDF